MTHVIRPRRRSVVTGLLVLAAATLALAAATIWPAGAAAADTRAPTVPTGVRVTATTLTTATLAWNRSSDDGGTVGYRVFELVWDPEPFEYREVLRAAVTEPAATIRDLQPDRGYLYVVRAVDPAGNVSGASAAVNAQTPADVTAPTAPGAPRATAVSFTTATVAWNASTDDDRVLGYRLSVDGAAPFFATDATTFSLRELDPGRTHTVRVSAIDSADNSSPATTVSFVTLTDAEPPSAPANLQGFVSGLDGFFRWTASRDNSGEARYELYLDDAATPFATAGFGQTSIGLFPLELAPGSHRVTVRARDRAGNRSGPSNAVTVGA